MKSDSRPVLVGEVNPHRGSPLDYALYPLPANSAGGRLCRLVMKLDMRTYIRGFDRRNLCVGTWKITVARMAAAEIERQVLGDGRAIVLLGTKVCAAFGVKFEPFTTLVRPGASRYVVLPHPSGLNRIWNEEGAFARARRVLVEAGVLEQVAA